MTQAPPVDVAVVAPFAGSLYGIGASSGGAEVQSLHIVRALAARGLAVRHVVAAPGGETLPETGPEVIWMSPEYFSGGLARRRALVAAVRSANARVYIQRSASFETGIVGAVARAGRRRFVFSSSSIVDFMLDPHTRETAGAGLESRLALQQYRLGLRLANAVVVQTEEQRDLARNRFGRDAIVIRSFGQPSPPGAPRLRRGFLWIGAFAEVKDPLSYVTLARLVPEAMFTMIGAERTGAERLAAEVRAAAKETANLRLVETPGRAAVLDAYESALAVVSTSRFEGFPNTFLEAWARGTPVLSLRVDPDGIVEQHRLGAVGHGSLEALAVAARSLTEAPPDEARSAELRRYVSEHHDSAVVGERWAQVVEGLL